jgi:hypothetical protein
VSSHLDSFCGNHVHHHHAARFYMLDMQLQLCLLRQYLYLCTSKAINCLPASTAAADALVTVTQLLTAADTSVRAFCARDARASGVSVVWAHASASCMQPVLRRRTSPHMPVQRSATGTIQSHPSTNCGDSEGEKNIKNQDNDKGESHVRKGQACRITRQSAIASSFSSYV